MLIKHVNCRDVAFEPRTRLKVPGGELVVGIWYNVAYSIPFALEHDELFITDAQAPNWRPYVPAA